MVVAMSATAASVTTDRAWYVAGEPMKVSIKADDAKIAYAELCDTRSMAAGCMVSIEGGEGTGTIQLPAELHSGYYVLSVYTRNNNKVATQLVAVVNTLHKSKDDDIEWVADESTWAQEGKPSAVYSSAYRAMPNIPEMEGHIVKAKVKNVYDGKTFNSTQISPSLSVVGKKFQYFEGKMINDSIAVFYTYGLHGKQPLVLTAETNTDVNLPIELISPYAVLTPKALPHLVFHYNRSEVEARSLSMQRHQQAPKPEPAVAAYDETIHGTKPDLSYNLDEYRQFLTIKEVLLEYVSCVTRRKVNGTPRLIVRKEHEQFSSMLPTLVIIDGMPVTNVDRLLRYDARRIHYINIYGGQYTFGKTVYNGILSFVTRSGQLTNYPVERNMQYVVYDFTE